MNFIKRFRTWLAYKQCLRKHDIAIERMNNCLDGTTIYRVWSDIAINYLEMALEYKEQLDA